MSFTKEAQTKKQPKKRKNAKSERKRLIDKLDDEIRRICRLRDTHCCHCGKVLPEGAQVSHFIGRRHYALRWHLKNCHMACSGCNLAHNHDPNPYAKFLVSTYGHMILTRFEVIKQNHTKTTTPQLRELLEELKTLE